jgi:biopolymer transport protein ExbD
MAGQVLEGDDDTALSDINVVPLTDVMLVLLIVFLITIPRSTTASR